MFFLKVLGLSMPVVYLCLGIYLLLSENIYNFSGFQQYGFGIVLILYGFIRLFFTLKKYREKDEEVDNEDS